MLGEIQAGDAESLEELLRLVNELRADVAELSEKLADLQKQVDTQNG